MLEEQDGAFGEVGKAAAAWPTAWPVHEAGRSLLVERALPGVERVWRDSDQVGELGGRQAAALPGVEDQEALLGPERRGPILRLLEHPLAPASRVDRRNRRLLPLSDLLVHDRRVLHQVAARSVDQQLPRVGHRERLGTLELEMDRRGIGVRVHYEVVLELLLIAVIDEVDAGQPLVILDARIVSDVVVPAGRIAANEVVGMTRQRDERRRALFRITVLDGADCCTSIQVRDILLHDAALETAPRH